MNNRAEGRCLLLRYGHLRPQPIDHIYEGRFASQKIFHAQTMGVDSPDLSFFQQYQRFDVLGLKCLLHKPISKSPESATWGHLCQYGTVAAVVS